MKDLVEGVVTDLLRASQRNERQGKPFPQNGNMTFAKNGNCLRFHRMNVCRYLFRVIPCARTIWASNQDHESFCVHFLITVSSSARVDFFHNSLAWERGAVGDVNPLGVRPCLWSRQQAWAEQESDS